MGINVNTNVESINAQRNLSLVTQRLATSYARLSSGLRITNASDDAAGLAIADNLRADSKIATVAIRNANDGISMVSIADGAMEQVTTVLTRMAELAEQSANGVYTTTQRSALDLEFRTLASEIERIAVTTQFNGLALLSGGGEVSLQVGFEGNANSRVVFSGVEATLASIGLANAGSSALLYSINGISIATAQESSRNSLNAVKAAIDSISRNRGTLGAAQSRLTITITNLQVARENISSAESRIRDVDVASESAELTRLNILQQAAAAVLGQANQQPQLALSLLK